MKTSNSSALEQKESVNFIPIYVTLAIWFALICIKFFLQLEALVVSIDPVTAGVITTTTILIACIAYFIVYYKEARREDFDKIMIGLWLVALLAPVGIFLGMETPEIFLIVYGSLLLFGLPTCGWIGHILGKLKS
ncbi:MAG: hypothetical protein WD552_00470 [Candidatus Paceibacterota bacterium]